MENKTEEEIITEENDPDSQKVIEDEEITPDNDTEKVTLVKDDPVCHQNEGEQVIGEGSSVLKPDRKAKEKGQRSWFSL